MDTDTLVEEMIGDGQKLIDLLLENEINVTAACWVKTSEEGAWFLYIATNEVDKNGLAKAYRKVYRFLRAIPNSWISTSVIKLVGENNPITDDLLEIHRRFPGKLPIRSRTSRLASISTEELYLYPLKEQPAIPFRQSFMVSYYRQGDTDIWHTKSKAGELYRGIKTKGAVGYSTTRWEGEKEGDEKHASVSVLLEVTPDPDSQIVFMHPALEQVWARQAEEMADEMFRERHPNAQVEHDVHDLD